MPTSLGIITECLKHYGAHFGCDQPVLCHGDYLPEHVFVDADLNVTGVIDFGLYQGEHPIFDLAVMAMGGHGAHLRHIRDGITPPLARRC